MIFKAVQQANKLLSRTRRDCTDVNRGVIYPGVIAKGENAPGHIYQGVIVPGLMSYIRTQINAALVYMYTCTVCTQVVYQQARTCLQQQH